MVIRQNPAQLYEIILRIAQPSNTYTPNVAAACAIGRALNRLALECASISRNGDADACEWRLAEATFGVRCPGEEHRRAHRTA